MSYIIILNLLENGRVVPVNKILGFTRKLEKMHVKKYKYKSYLLIPEPKPVEYARTRF
jgi:hypothetical protein